MKKTFLITIAALALLFFTAFRATDTPAETTEHKGMPEEKKEQLNKIAGRWITQTNIYARNGQPASKVIGSDVWQWSPDGNFLLHIAYGIRDKNGFGGMEITGYNTKTGGFDSYNYNPDGSFSMGSLSIKNDVWVWTSEDVRTTGIMNEDNKLLTVKHEIKEDGKTYEYFMDGVLIKGSDH